MNFRESSNARTFLRAGIATALAFLGALATALVDNSVQPTEWVTIMIATLTALGAYLGIGAVTVSEPFFGTKQSVAAQPPVAVPSPPAVDETP